MTLRKSMKILENSYKKRQKELRHWIKTIADLLKKWRKISMSRILKKFRWSTRDSSEIKSNISMKKSKSKN